MSMIMRGDTGLSALFRRSYWWMFSLPICDQVVSLQASDSSMEWHSYEKDDEYRIYPLYYNAYRGTSLV